MVRDQAHGPLKPPIKPSQVRSESAGTPKATAQGKRPDEGRGELRDITHRQKRLIALALVILVSVIIPVLALTLIFAP